MNWTVVQRILGLLLMVFSITMLPPILVSRSLAEERQVRAVGRPARARIRPLVVEELLGVAVEVDDLHGDGVAIKLFKVDVADRGDLAGGAVNGEVALVAGGERIGQRICRIDIAGNDGADDGAVV